MRYIFLLLAALLTAAHAAAPVVPGWPIIVRDSSSNRIVWLECRPVLNTGTSAERASAFLKANASILGITNPESELLAYRTETDKYGVSHIHYAQSYKGLPVVGGGAVVHVGGGKPDSISAGLAAGLNLSIMPNVAKETAETAAVQQFARDFPGVPPVAKQTTLVVYSSSLIENRHGQDACLSWLVNVENEHCPECPALADENYYVETETGAVVKRLSNIRHGNWTRHIYDCTPRLWDPLCWINKKFIDHYPTYIFGRGETNPERGPNPVYGYTDTDDLHALLGQVGDYYLTTFNRNGGNNQGGLGTGNMWSGNIYQVYQTKGETYLDASSNWTCPNASFSNGLVNFCAGMVVPDVVGHEYAHAIPFFTFGGLVYYGESGAVEESHSDLFGEAFEKHQNGTTNWISGLTGLSGSQPRSLSNPPSLIRRIDGLPFPDRLHSQWYYCSGGDQGGVHINSTAVSKAFYVMSEGRAFNGCTITGIGLDKVEQILYRAMVTYYVPTETFNQAYIAIQRSAADLYSDVDCWQVKKALQAVELDQQSPCSGGTERTPYAATPINAGDIGRALSISAGLASADSTDIGRLDVALTGDSFLRVDTRDAAFIARMVAGLTN